MMPNYWKQDNVERLAACEILNIVHTISGNKFIIYKFV